MKSERAEQQSFRLELLRKVFHSGTLAAPLAVRDNHDFLKEVEMRFGHKHGPIKQVTQTLVSQIRGKTNKRKITRANAGYGVNG